MKINVEIDCTPEEARKFFGLPDVQDLQSALLGELEEKMRDNLSKMDPEALLRTWMPAGALWLEQLQKMFWSQFAGGTDDGKTGEN